MKLLKELISPSWRLYGNENESISNITDDSRKVTKGSLFVAVSGLTVDAHQFIPQAIKQGAVALVGEKDPDKEWISAVSYIKVPNSRQALGEIASAWFDYPASKMKVIGVTGTDGKTTTTYFIHQLLIANNYKSGMVSTVKALVGNKEIDTGFHTTTPDPLELQKILAIMARMQIQYVVLEVTSIGIDQHRIAGIHFDVTVLTNITPEHLAYHKTFKEYRDVKLKFLQQAPVSILNKDDSSYDYLKSKLRNNKILVYDINTVAKYTLPFSEQYNRLNAAAAITVTKELGLTEEEIKRALHKLHLPEGRLQRVKNNKGINIIIDFAHTPNALENLLSNVKSKKQGKLIVIFGCASERDDSKRPVMAEIATRLSDMAVLTTEDPRKEPVSKIIKEMISGIPPERNNYVVKEDRGEAISYAINTLANKGDMILVCGKGHEKSMNYDGVEYPWSDEDAINSALKGEVFHIKRNE